MPCSKAGYSMTSSARRMAERHCGDLFAVRGEKRLRRDDGSTCPQLN
jgi:hypothetical protein